MSLLLKLNQVVTRHAELQAALCEYNEQIPIADVSALLATR